MKEIEELLGDMGGVFEAALKMSADLAPKVAKVYKLYFDEFKAAGFSDEQAIALLSRLPILQQSK